MEEIWKDVRGYEGLYQVSNIGRVKSLERRSYPNNGKSYFIKNRILKEIINKVGYSVVCLRKDGSGKFLLVHRLVVESFISPINELEVDHINTIRKDNRVSNLRLVTHLENCYNSITRRSVLKANNNKSKPVAQIEKLTGKLINKFISVREASRQTGIHQYCITNTCRGKQLYSGGYRWKYI